MGDSCDITRANVSSYHDIAKCWLCLLEDNIRQCRENMGIIAGCNRRDCPVLLESICCDVGISSADCPSARAISEV